MIMQDIEGPAVLSASLEHGEDAGDIVGFKWRRTDLAYAVGLHDLMYGGRARAAWCGEERDPVTAPNQAGTQQADGEFHIAGLWGNRCPRRASIAML
jgi:hypothetical protein